MPHKQRSGFTLLDLLFALALALILGLLGSAGMSSLLQNTYHTNALETVITSLDRARSMAVISGRRVAVCTTTNTTICNADWSGENLMIFVDANKDRELNPDEDIVYTQPLPPDIQISWSGALHNPIISYQPDGSIVANGKLELHDFRDAHWQKTIYISKPGRARIE